MYEAVLISKTMPVKEFTERTGCKDAEDLISYCARVSNPSNQTNFETSEKLLNYCVRKKHWSIFTMADATFEIDCTRDIGRQILRHWSADFQEFSQRYAIPNLEDFYIRECRFQHPTNRQSSIEIGQSGYDPVIAAEWKRRQELVLDCILEHYQWAIDNNIAKECARVVLSEGLTPSVMYMKMSVRDWFHYCTLRTDMGTQKEHRIIAQNIWDGLLPHFSFLESIKIQ